METQSFFGTWYVRILSVLILIGVVVALGAYTHYTLKQATYTTMGPTTINVRGEGEVSAPADIGQFSFSVRAEGVDASTAQDLSAEAINTIMAFLKDSDVADKDIKTQNYNLNPKYRYEERVCTGTGYCPPGERVIDGYEVSQTVQVKVRDLDAAGDLISGAGDRGATNISSLRFTIDDESVLQAEARAKAIVDAQEKAAVLAGDLDVRIVRMVAFWEDEGGRDGIYLESMAMDSSGGGFEKSISPSLPVGENSVVSNVNITYEIR